jgi:streptogramin lyase
MTLSRISTLIRSRFQRKRASVARGSRLELERLEPRQVLTGFLRGYAVSGPIGGVAPGSDGSMWFITDYEIGRIRQDGQIDDVASPGYGAGQRAITEGPDGNIWFVSPDSSQPSGSVVGRVTPDGVKTAFDLPAPNSAAGDITAGPDGNLWFTEPYGNKIGRITPSGDITEFAVPDGAGSGTLGRITAGPDGALWFTDNHGSGEIGRITTSGQITLFPLSGTGQNDLEGISAGADGALWFVETPNHKIGRITTSGAITEFTIPSAPGTSMFDLGGITTGTDGNLWFTENSTTIGQISTSGQITQFPLPAVQYSSFLSGNNAITTGADGNLWIAERDRDIIDQFSPTDASIARGVNARGTAQLDDSFVVATYVTSGDVSQDSGTINWGDGTTSAASFEQFSLSASDKFQAYVSANHVYVRPGDYTVSTTLSTGGHTQTTTSTVHVVGSAAITAYGLSPSSAVGLPNTETYIAQFTSADASALADSFSATIDWGDGTTTPALISLKPPTTPIFFAYAAVAPTPSYGARSFVVSGNHAYSQPGHYTPHVNIIDAAHDAASADSKISVAPPETLTSSTSSLAAFPGEAISGLTVATFNDSAPGLVADDFSATIDWGDGTTTTGKINQNYYVYDQGTITSASPSAIIVPGPGQNQGSTGTVSGDHTYQQAGTYQIKVVMTSLSGVSTSVTDTALVGPILPIVYGLNQVVGAQQSPIGYVGYLRVQDGTAKAGDFTVTIEWGDGTTTTGALTDPYSPVGRTGQPQNETDFSIRGSHAYARAGNFTISVTVARAGGGSATGSAPASVVDESITGIPATTSASASVPFNAVTVGSFNDNNFQLTTSDFTAVISWGDGTSSAGSIVPATFWLPPIGVQAASSSSIANPIFIGARFAVNGSHTYDHAGTYHVDITVHSKGGAAAVIHSTMNVSNAPPETIQGTGTTFFGFAGKPLSDTGVLVGTFTDLPHVPNTAPFTAVIDWGDGSAPTVGQIDVIAAAGGTRANITAVPIGNPPLIPIVGTLSSVYGNHTYAHPGLYHIHITVAHGPGVSATINSGVDILAASPEVIAPMPTPVKTTLVPKAVSLNVTSFLDSDPTAKASSFDAQISWGDHTAPTHGTVTAYSAGPGSPAGAFAVSGMHHYARVGTYTVHVSIARIGGPVVTTSSVVVVKRRPVGQPSGGGVHPAAPVHHAVGHKH